MLRSLLLLTVAVLATACGEVVELGVGTPDQARSHPPVTSPTGPDDEDTNVEGLIAYGPGADQVIDLSIPDGDGPFPVVVLIHGGFWREQYRRDLMEPLASDLVGRGVAVANLEYGRVGGTGGWPETLEDVAAGLDRVATLTDPRLDLTRVGVVGHSAGGHLASWAAARPQLPSGLLGADPALRPCAVVSQAGVNDLTRAAEERLGDGAVQDLLGGDAADVSERYDAADPARHLPLSAPWLAVHGRDDDTVPLGQSEDFADALRAAGGTARVEVLDGDHFTVIDPADASWAVAVAFLAEHCRW